MWNSGRLPSISATVSPRATPELREAARERVDAVAQLRPGEADLVVLRAHRDAVRVVLDGQAGTPPPSCARRPRGGGRRPWSSPPCGEPTRTWKPSPVSRPMSFVRPDTNRPMTEREADEPGALHDAERDRAAAHLLGQRPEDVPAVERQEREQVDHRRATARSPRAGRARGRPKLDRLARRLVGADDAGDLLALVGVEDAGDRRDRPAREAPHLLGARRDAPRRRRRGSNVRCVP